ncbi:monocarboxylate transporter 5-like [Liolophura sinensis]|uniref:monocarboxylate transporter 5-like n=1 Tax=Liolophura sinensis TaxID=3198878 RepID=UPI003159430E
MADNHSQKKDVDGENLTENEMGNNSVHSKHPDVDRGWAWLVAIGMAMFYFTIGGFFRSFGVVFSAVLEQFDQTASLTSLVPGVRSVCLIVIGPAATILSQRLTERVVIMAGAITVTAGFVLSYFATSLQFLIFSIGMMPGMGTSLIVGPSNVMMGRYFNRRRARAITVTSSVGCLGQIVVPLIMVHLIETYSVQGALLIFGGIILHTLLTGLIMKPINLSSITLNKNESEIETDNCNLTGKISKADSIEITKKDESIKKHFSSSKADDEVEMNERATNTEVLSVNIVNEGKKELPDAIIMTGKTDVSQVINKDGVKPLTIKDLEEVSDEADVEMEWKNVSKANTNVLETNSYELQPLTHKDESAHDSQDVSLTVVSTRLSRPSCTKTDMFSGRGLIKDFSGKYDAMFPLTGGLQISAGLLLLLECFLRRRAKKKRMSS